LLSNNANLKKKLLLQTPAYYHYLNQSDCVKIDGVNDTEHFQSLTEALMVIGITEAEQLSIFSILSIVLYMGNIQFTGKNGKADDHAVVKSTEELATISKLMGLEPEAVSDALTQRNLAVRNGKSFYKVPLTVEQAADGRDAFAKGCYGFLFDWLINRINQTIQYQLNAQTHNFIGILDIFGFEVFQQNSFEQFCINWASEKLQQCFINYLFKMELAEYQKEGLNVVDGELMTQLQGIDNQVCIDLIEKKPSGLTNILDDECRLPKGTDLSFVEKIYATHQKAATPQDTGSFLIKKKKKNSPTEFVISHYAGEVTYEAKGFLEKNRDLLYADFENLVEISSNKFLRDLFAHNRKLKLATMDARKLTKSQAETNSICAKFKEQLSSLITVLTSTECHFVRCVKSNTLKEANNFDANVVKSQLNYLGITQSILVRRSGYPIRMTFDQFMRRYQLLSMQGKGKRLKFQNFNTMLDWLIQQKLIQTPDEKNDQVIPLWRTGKTKIFMKDEQYQALEAQRDSKITHVAVIIQGLFYMYKFKKMKKATTNMQALIRTIHARKLLQKLKIEEQKRKEEEERRRREEEERKRLEEEKRRREEEERRRIEEERRRKEEEERKRLEAERRKKEEEERRKREEEERKRLEEDKRKLEEERKRKEEEERKRLEEERCRLEAEQKRRQEEERKRIQEEEELKRKQEEQTKAEQARMQEELQKHKQEDSNKYITERKKIENERRRQEAKRLEEEQRRIEEQARKLLEESQLLEKEEQYLDVQQHKHELRKSNQTQQANYGVLPSINVQTPPATPPNGNNGTANPGTPGTVTSFYDFPLEEWAAQFRSTFQPPNSPRLPVRPPSPSKSPEPKDPNAWASQFKHMFGKSEDNKEASQAMDHALSPDGKGRPAMFNQNIQNQPAEDQSDHIYGVPVKGSPSKKKQETLDRQIASLREPLPITSQAVRQPSQEDLQRRHEKAKKIDSELQLLESQIGSSPNAAYGVMPPTDSPPKRPLPSPVVQLNGQETKPRTGSDPKKYTPDSILGLKDEMKGLLDDLKNHPAQNGNEPEEDVTKRSQSMSVEQQEPQPIVRNRSLSDMDVRTFKDQATSNNDTKGNLLQAPGSPERRKWSRHYRASGFRYQPGSVMRRHSNADEFEEEEEEEEQNHLPVPKNGHYSFWARKKK